MASKTGFVFLCVLLGVCCFRGSDGECVDVGDNCRDYDSTICAQYNSWATKNCAKTCGFCKKVKVCPDGWKLYKGDQTCLQAVGFSHTNDKTTWFNAQGQCQFKGGNLVIIKDAYKNAFVKAMTPKSERTWIGLKNTASRGFLFKFTDGSGMSAYHPWLPNNPDNYNDQERCVVMTRDYNYDGQWNDYSCEERLGYICQKKAAISPVINVS